MNTFTLADVVAGLVTATFGSLYVNSRGLTTVSTAKEPSYSS